VNEPQEAGTYEVKWDGEDENANEVSSGIYFYRLEAGDFIESRKMLLLK
jgi:flagellar hook assembly protein FlgD